MTPGSARARLVRYGSVAALAVIALAACVDVTDKNAPGFRPATGSGTFLGINYAAPTIADVSVYNINGAPPFDPVVVAGSDLVIYPAIGGVAVLSGYNSGTNSWATVVAMAFAPIGAAGPGIYPMASNIAFGGSIFDYKTAAGSSCSAGSGTLTINNYGAPLEAVIGSFNVTSWAAASTLPCPTLPATGSFVVARSMDYHAGNDYSGTDTLSITRTGSSTDFPAAQTFTESASVPNDPLMTVLYTASSASTTINLQAEGDPGLSPPALLRSIAIQLPGTPTPSTFTVDNSTVKFSEAKTIDTGGGTFTSNTCTAAAGVPTNTVTISSVSAPGGKVVGTFNISGAGAITISGAGPAVCPTAYSGSFSITREKDQ